MIAVMGAAGHVGSQVADALLRAHQRVRVLEHRRTLQGLGARGAEVVAGDASSVEDLRTLFRGAGAALVLLPEDVSDPRFVATRSRIARALAQALRESAVPHVVALSALGADQPTVAGPPAGLREYEQRLSELPETNVLVLRSSLYMDYLLASLPMIRSQRSNGSAIRGDVQIPMVATRDVAAEAAVRLVRRDVAGYQIKLLLGPEDVTMREATRLMGELLGMPDLPYVQFPAAEVQRALRAAGMSDEAAALLVDMQLAIGEGRQFGRVTRTAESATPTRLQEFLSDALAHVQQAQTRKGEQERGGDA